MCSVASNHIDVILTATMRQKYHLNLQPPSNGWRSLFQSRYEIYTIAWNSPSAVGRSFVRQRKHNCNGFCMFSLNCPFQVRISRYNHYTVFKFEATKLTNVIHIREGKINTQKNISLPSFRHKWCTFPYWARTQITIARREANFRFDFI